MKTITTLLCALAIVSACSKSDDKPKPGDRVPTPGIAISVTEKGFEPENVSVQAGKPVTLVFTRKTDGTCAKEVVIPLEGQKIEKKLPLNEPVAVEVTFPKAGQITYACGMDMIKAVITVQ